MRLSRDFAYRRYDRNYLIKDVDQLNKALDRKKSLDTMLISDDSGNDYLIDRNTNMDKMKPKLIDALNKGDRLISSKHRNKVDQRLHDSRMNDINMIKNAVGTGAKIAGAGYGLHTAISANKLLNSMNNSNIIQNVDSITGDVKTTADSLAGKSSSVGSGLVESAVKGAVEGTSNAIANNGDSIGRFVTKVASSLTPDGQTKALEYLDSTGLGNYIDFDKLIE